jgi:aspartate aminotransferase-like enzyme
MLMDQQFLRIPGPTPIPPRVERAMAKPMIGHRDKETTLILESIQPKIKKIFGTEEEVNIIAGSGTAGLEAAVVNTTKAQDHVLVLVTGAFGDRFAKICQAYELNVHKIEVLWGESVQPDQVREYLLDHPEIKVVFATYCETSTGVLNPVKKLAAVIKEVSNALFIVDGVSCIGGVEAKKDDWGIDILVTGSQKALMVPPGLTLIAVSKRAWKRIKDNPQPRFYFNLLTHYENLRKGTTPYTPAISLLFGLDEALQLIEEEGFKEVVQRHEVMKKMTREACKALDLSLLAADEDASPTVTAVIPEDFSADQFRKVVKHEYGLNLAGGQQHLQGKVFRIGHMGYCSPADVLQTISLIELGLHQMNIQVEFGAGVRAAQQVYVNYLERREV